MSENTSKRAGSEPGGERRTSRRGFLAGTAGATALIGAALETGPAAGILLGQSAGTAIDEETTLTLVNGKIHTMDARNAVVNTVSIRNGRFVAVGGRPPKAGRAVRVI